MIAALYARVSTRDQEPENQMLDLRRYAAARGWEIAGEFVDFGISGAKEDRPSLSAVMTLARRRQIGCVLIWRFDRFARSLRHLINALGELTELGVHFVSFTEAVDTSTSQGRMMVGVLGALAEFERDLIRERILAGIRRARDEGKQLGRRPVPLDLANVRQLRAQGISLREIGADYEVSGTTILRALRNPQNRPGLAPSEVAAENCKMEVSR